MSSRGAAKLWLQMRFEVRHSQCEHCLREARLAGRGGTGREGELVWAEGVVGTSSPQVAHCAIFVVTDGDIYYIGTRRNAS